MTDDTRGAIADLAAIGFAAIAAYVVATNPGLRRVLWRAVKFGMLTAAPQLLWQETQRAWQESATREQAANVNLP
jgi:hypothetical protein